MRVLVGLALLLWLVRPAQAGLYNTSEPEEGKLSRDNFALNFRDTLLRLRSIGMPKIIVDNALRKRYLMQAELAARANLAKLTTEQKLNLGAVLIRCKKADEAINLLTPLSRQEPRNFLVQSNLATAYQQVGQERRAIDTLKQALADWPATLGEVQEPFRTYLQFIGWHEGAFDFYRKAETYQLKLLELRAREALAGKGATFTTVDALFDVKFVAESGKFEPGKLARAEHAKLPKDAIEIVQQLLVWLPEDVRLYWLLGELYNAQGSPKNLKAARMIFEELGGFGGLNVRAEELAEHRRALLSHEVLEEGQIAAGDLTRDLDEIEKKKDAAAPRIDWQTLGVGFGTGLLVAIFGLWQIREIRRRRLSRGDIK